MSTIWMVGLGGAVGSIGRYAVGQWAERMWPAAALPVGTLIVNVVGCFLIGLVAAGVELRDILNPEWRALLIVGVLGGFTTFSTFAHESLTLGRDDQTAWALGNILASVALGLLAVWLGMTLGRALFRV